MDIIYSAITAKNLDIKSACHFLNLGADDQGNPKIIDTELSNSLGDIDKLMNWMGELLPVDGDQLQTIALATFPDNSAFADHPLNPALSEIQIMRVYINGLIQWVEEGNAKKHKTEYMDSTSLERKVYAEKKGCGAMMLSIAFGIIGLCLLFVF